MHVCPTCGHLSKSGGVCHRDATTMVDCAASAMLGEMVGPYRLVQVLGVGGMGTVFLGVHLEIRSRVAIKVLSKACASDAEMVQRFFDEARAVNVIQHAGLVNIIDLAELDDGRPYIQMDYLEGETLGDRLASGPLPVSEAVRVVGLALDAIAAAHRAKIIHRDLKPDNIFLLADGRVQVLDFGIAKLRRSSSAKEAVTVPGTLLGTPHYMSPEQAMGEAVEPSSDTYAMGLVLYEALAGTRAIDLGTLRDIVAQHETEGVTPELAAIAHVPPGIVAVITKAVSRRPTDRYADAREMHDALMSVDLDACELVDPIPSPAPITPLERAPTLPANDGAPDTKRSVARSDEATTVVARREAVDAEGEEEREAPSRSDAPARSDAPPPPRDSPRSDRAPDSRRKPKHIGQVAPWIGLASVTAALGVWLSVREPDATHAGTPAESIADAEERAARKSGIVALDLERFDSQRHTADAHARAQRLHPNMSLRYWAASQLHDGRMRFSRDPEVSSALTLIFGADDDTCYQEVVSHWGYRPSQPKKCPFEAITLPKCTLHAVAERARQAPDHRGPITAVSYAHYPERGATWVVKAEGPAPYLDDHCD